MASNDGSLAQTLKPKPSDEDLIREIGWSYNRPFKSGPFFTKEQSRINKAERLLSLNVWRALYFEEAKMGAKSNYRELMSVLDGDIFSMFNEDYPPPPRPPTTSSSDDFSMWTEDNPPPPPPRTSSV